MRLAVELVDFRVPVLVLVPRPSVHCSLRPLWTVGCGPKGFPPRHSKGLQTTCQRMVRIFLTRSPFFDVHYWFVLYLFRKSFPGFLVLKCERNWLRFIHVYELVRQKSLLCDNCQILTSRLVFYSHDYRDHISFWFVDRWFENIHYFVYDMDNLLNVSDCIWFNYQRMFWLIQIFWVNIIEVSFKLSKVCYISICGEYIGWGEKPQLP